MLLTLKQLVPAGWIVFLKLFLGNSNFGPIEKRRKPTQLSTMTYLLEDSDILDDLKIINKNKAFTVSINI
jgi:hypothetical protein